MTREELASRIAETSVLHGDFTLRSGRKSTWYIDKYRFSTQPDILEALGDMLAEQVTEGVTLLAGAELGGIPLVTAAAFNFAANDDEDELLEFLNHSADEEESRRIVDLAIDAGVRVLDPWPSA